MASSAATASVPAPDGTIPPLTRAASAPIDMMTSSSSPRAPARSHLAPEDAFYTASPPSRRRLNGFESSASNSNNNIVNNNNNADSGPEQQLLRSRRLRSKLARRRKRSWKKILWVKQSFPDNYTDQTTFLDSLQRNPRLQPYDFWPLVADSTVIVQQVCAVTIFVVCFAGIFTERVSPVAVVGWASFATFIGWLLWDWWVGQEDENELLQRQNSHRSRGASPSKLEGGSNSTTAVTPSAASSTTNLGLADRTSSYANPSVVRQHPSGSAVSLQSTTSQYSHPARYSVDVPDGQRHRPSSPLRGGRTTLRMSTIKSAVLIYFTILGLSPILKSLTRSTSPDSIWAMSFWLLTINIFFFDYSGGVGAKFPASLSTNAALMASTVLASRLPSTGQVFSLTLFSIEVFGLFPVFRRYARHQSWRYHVLLTVMLVIGAGGGVGLIVAEKVDGVWPWRSGLLGVFVGALIVVVAMGASAWWLIGLQKYKNAMNGPWDAARPIIISRRHWEYDE